MHRPEARTHAGCPGYPPDMRRLPAGCPFQPRCPRAFDACEQSSPLLLRRGDAAGEPPADVACFLYDSASPDSDDTSSSEGLTAGGGRA